MRIRTIVAGHDEYVASVRRVVRGSRRLELLGSVAHAAACVSRALETNPDLVVLDVDLPGNAIAAATEIAARLPETGMIMTHASSDREPFLNAVAAGVSAYIDRSASRDALEQAMVTVGSGDVAFSKADIRDLAEALRDRSRPRRRLAARPELTAREWQIYEMMRRRMSAAEIAERLALSPVTVRSHTRSIRNKLAKTS